MLDSIHHLNLNYFEIAFLRENATILPYICDVIEYVNT